MKAGKTFIYFLKGIIFLFLLLKDVASKAQLSGTYHIPSDYSTLATAIADLNSQGVSAAVTIVVDASNPQTAPIGGYVIGGAGSALLTSTSALNAVTINGGGNTITAFSPQTAGILNDAILKLIGADYITLTGFTMIENPSNTGTTVAASQTRTEFGVALFYVSTTDGSQHNTITNNDISLNRTYQNSFGIFSTTRTTSISPLVVAVINNAAGSNSFNDIFSNTIHNVNMGICLIGSGAPTAANAMDNGNNIGAVGTGNSITDWGNADALSAYPSVGYINAVTTTAGIYTNYQYNLNIVGNTLVSANIIQTSSRAVNGICDNYAIALTAAVNTTIQPTGTIYKNINNNTVTVTNTPIFGATGNNEMIQTAGLGTAALPLSTATYSISNNLILNCSILGPEAGGIFWRGIRAAAACGTIMMDNNTLRGNVHNGTFCQVQLLRQAGAVTTDVFIRNNKFGDATGPCITFTDSANDAHFGLIDNGGVAATLHTITGNDFQNTFVENVVSSKANLYLRLATTGSCDVSNNTFTNNVNMKQGTRNDGTTGGIRFFEDIPGTGGHAASTTVKWNNNSIVGSFTNTGNISDFRIYTNAVAGPTAPSSVIEENNNNNFSNITLDTVSGFFGWINSDGLPGAGPKKTASGNTFSNWNIKSGSVNGLLGVSNSDINYASNNVINNTITNITSHDGSITGIISASGSQNFVGNTISGLSTTGASVKGIDLQAGNNQNIKKNKICDLETNNVAGFVTGIKVNGLSSTEISNNIIGDLRTPVTNADSAVKGISIVGVALAKVYNNTVYLSGTSSGALWGSSDIMVNTTPSFEFINNIFFNTSISKGTGKSIAFTGPTSILSDFGAGSDRNDYNAATIYTDGTNTFNSFGPYATFVGATREAHSFSQTPPFLSTTCGDANFLHINTLIQTRVESGGTNIASVTDDFDGNSRNASTPDIGADEFSGISPPPCTGAPTVGSITGSGFLCSGSGTILILSGASTDLGITYQWNSGTTQGGPYPNVLETGTYQATGPLTVPSYYKVTITCTNLGGSSATTVEKAVLINALPAVTVLPTSGLICLPGGVPISLTAGGALTYLWLPVQGLSAFSGSVVSSSPLLNTTYIVTGTDANGCTNSSTSTVSVSNTPTNLIATSTPPLVCTNGTSTLNVTAGLTIPSYASLYSFAASNTTFTPLTGAVNVSTIEADDASALVPFGFIFIYEGNSYTSALANSNGYLSMINATHPEENNLATGIIRPVIAPLWDDLSGKTGANSPTPTGTASYSTVGIAGSRVFTMEWLNWYWDYSATDSSISFQVKLYEADGHIEFIYRAESGTPKSAAASVGLSGAISGIFLSLSNLSASPSASAVNETKTISTKPASGQRYTFSPPTSVPTYSWSPSNGLSPNASVQSPISTPALGATVFTVTITNNGCAASATTTITGGALPAATASSNSPVCEGSTLNLTSGGGASYSWIGANGFTSTLQNPVLPNASIVIGGTYTVTVSGASGCTASATAVVIVNTVPGATATISSSNSTICGGSTASLSTQSGIISPTYSWSASGGALAGLPGIINIPAINVSPQAVTTTIYTYTVVVTDPSNSCTSSSSVSLTVSPAVIAHATELNPVTCIHTTNSIEVTASGGTLPYSGTGVFNVSGGSHVYIVTDAAGCSSSVNITVTGELSFSLPALTELCNENPPTLTLIAEGGLPPYNFTGQTTNLTAGFYAYTVTDANNCTAITQTTISFVNCIVPSIPSSGSGKENTDIGSDLTQIHNNPDSIADSTNTQYVVDLGDILIEVVANMGYYDSLLVLLQTPAYGMTDLFDNGDSTLIITGFFPQANLLLLNNLPLLINAVRAYNPPINNSLASGIAYSLGDSSINASGAREAFKVEGEGVKVGVLSDSYNLKSGNHAQIDVNNGDLPGIGNPYNTNSVEVFSEYPYGIRSDEGRAMLQIVHDVAPKAKLAFRSGFVSPGDFSDGIKELQQNGCDVIVDDVTFITEPFFKDGVVAQAVDFVKSQGVSYFTAAGNYGVKSYEGFFNPVNPPAGYVGLAHNFGGGDFTQGVSLSRGLYTIVLQWEDSIYSLGQLPGALNDLDIFLVDNLGKRLFGFNRVNTGEDPMEILQFIVRSNTTANILITKAIGNANVRFKYIVFRGDLTINEHNSMTSTLVGQANAAGSMAVGAVLYSNTPAFGVTPPTIASFSSAGGTTVEGVVRNKPEFVGPNGVNTSVNFNHLNIDGDLLPNFFGTSCAAPHVAGAAALLIEARRKYYNSILIPDSVKSILQSTASDMGVAGFDYASGYGLIQTDAALNKYVTPKPILTQLIQNPLIIPGKLPFTASIKGKYFKTNSKVYLRGVEIPATIINSTTITSSIPVFSGNPALQIYSPPISTSGIDGGFSEPKFFLPAPRKTVTVTVDNKSKKYGDTIPFLTATVLVDGIPYQNTAYTLQSLGLGNMQINTSAISTSDIGLYLIRASIDPLDPLDPDDLLFLEHFDYVFNDGFLVINKMPITINPRDTTLSYGDKIHQIHFNYIYNDQAINVAERSSFFNSIKTIHNSTLDTAVAFIDDQAIVGGRIVINSDLDGIGFLSSGRSITNGRIVINRALANSLNFDSTIVVDVSPKSIFDYQLDSANGTLVDGRALVNGRIVINGNAVVNGRIVINGTAVANSLNINDSTNGNVVVIIDSADVYASGFDTIALKSINLITGFEVGTHLIVPGAFLSENFDITYGLGTLTIIPSELIATADDTSRYVGDVDPVFTISYSGFKYMDGPNNIIESIALTTATQPSPSGTYSISSIGGSGDNYFFTNIDGTLIIKARLILNLKMFIEGYYNGDGLMDNFGAGGSLYLTGVSSNFADVDSVKLSLMDPVSKLEVEHQTGILQINGDLVVAFGGAIKIGNPYYIVISHRNSISTWSAVPVTINALTSFDFTH